MRTHPLRRLFRSFLRSSEGNIAIISALMIPVIVGFCGLVGETSYWYYRHRNIQDAADFAAYGAALTLGQGGDPKGVGLAAKESAVNNGWREESGTIEVTLDGPRVEVLLIENQPRYFTRLICGTPTIPIGARGAAVGVRGRAKLVWIDEERDTRGRLSTGCSSTEAVRVKSAREK